MQRCSTRITSRGKERSTAASWILGVRQKVSFGGLGVSKAFFFLPEKHSASASELFERSFYKIDGETLLQRP